MVAIFWDYDNGHMSSNLGVYGIINKIREIALAFGCVKLFKAYIDVSQPCFRSELQSSGVSVTDYPPKGRKDVAGKMILVDMLTYAMDNPSPTTIILISGDHDFAYAVSTLRLRQYIVVVIAQSGPASHISLKSQASFFFDWHRDILGMSQIGTRIATEGVLDQPNTPSSNPGSHTTSATLTTSDGTGPLRSFADGHNSGKPIQNPKLRKEESSTKLSDAEPSHVVKQQPECDGQLRRSPSSAANTHSRSTAIVPTVANRDWPKGFLSHPRDNVMPSLQSEGDGHHYGAALEGSTSPRRAQSRTGFGGREPTFQADAHSASENGLSVGLAPNSIPSAKPEQTMGPSFGLINQATNVQPSSPVTSIEFTGQPNCEAHSADPSGVDSNMTCKFATPCSTVSQLLPSVHDPGDETSNLHDSHRLPTIPITETRIPPFLHANETTSGHGEGIGLHNPLISRPNFRSESATTVTSDLPVGVTPSIVGETALSLPIVTPSVSKLTTPNNASALTMWSKHLPEEFRALVEMLEKERRNGNHQVLRSKCAYALVQRDQMVYKRAGVKKFSEYSALAVKAGLVRLGGTDGDAWISLLAELQHLRSLSGSAASSNNPDTTNGANGPRHIQVSQSPSGPTSWTANKMSSSANVRPRGWQPETSSPASTIRPAATVVARPLAPLHPYPNALPFSALPPSTSKISTTFTVKQLAKTVPDEFTALVQLLEKESLDGNGRVLRSKVAIALVERDRMVYKRAGVNRFSQYAALAENAGIVQLGGTDGGAWIALRSD